MRKIKFRTWNKKDKKMEIHDLREDIPDDCVYDYCQSESCGSKCNCELMQFTGLYDKNEKEIYEGDVVEFHSNKREVVEFKKGAFINFIETGGSKEEGVFVDFISGIYCEVIGNIYENPEFVKGQDTAQGKEK